ncbi:hypothetical protein [Methylovulum miyakonense]|uniref:hypothetical protein n=1 Tax=Methylovulum miyakonense TaxID=645578 RepID=UPI000374B9DF|nr:hypothetical protein [Methylovulum miyakonense]
MNKITPHLLRDLHATLPEGTERYLCSTVRKALAKYRNDQEPLSFLEQDQALLVLRQRLGRGLERFFVDDVKAALSSYVGMKWNQMA